MIEITPVSPRELRALCLNAAEPWLRENADKCEECAAYGPEWIMRQDGVAVMAGGFMEFKYASALAWVIIARETDLALTMIRTCRRYLKQAPYLWIEAQVADNFDASLRFVKLVGFQPIGHCYGFDGTRLNRFVFKDF